MTMMPALDWLQLNAGRMGRPAPAFFYWGSGALSSVLDNAPAYLGFLSALLGLSADSPAAGPGHGDMAFLIGHPGFSRCLLALSVGAVFFGASTYIGNGPNFMVKSIADQQQVNTPTFGGFIFKYTLPCLLPVLLLIWWLFFRG